RCVAPATSACWTLRAAARVQWSWWPVRKSSTLWRRPRRLSATWAGPWSRPASSRWLPTMQLVLADRHRNRDVERIDGRLAADGERARGNDAECFDVNPLRFAAEHIAVVFAEAGTGNGFTLKVQAGNARISGDERCGGNIHFDRHMEDRAHAGADHLAIVHIDTAGSQQAAEITEPGERAQDGPEVARILDAMQVDGPFAGARQRCGQHRHHGDDALRRTRLADLRHLPGIDHLHRQRRGEIRVLARAVQGAGAQADIPVQHLQQLLHRMLALHQEAAALLAVLALLQLAHLVDLHARFRATASATRMPSTPADRMPPAYPAPSPHGYRPRTFRLCRVSSPRVMRTGDEVRVSTPVSTASSRSKPRICRPKAGSASRMASMAKSGRAGARSPSRTPGL